MRLAQRLRLPPRIPGSSVPAKSAKTPLARDGNFGSEVSKAILPEEKKLRRFCHATLTDQSLLRMDSRNSLG